MLKLMKLKLMKLKTIELKQNYEAKHNVSLLADDAKFEEAEVDE